MSLDRIYEAEEELRLAEEEYLAETPWCQNKGCSFWRERSTGHCTWSVKLEDCRDYTSEQEEDKFVETCQNT